MAKTTITKTSLKMATPEDIWKDYNPEKALAALKRMAGSWSEINTDKLTADIRRWRKDGSRP